MTRLITIDPLDNRRALTLRLMKHVVVKGEDECWPWVGSELDGYGQVTYRGRSYPAHRFGFVLLVGPLRTDQEVHHTCEDTLCMNPKHWRALTHKEHVSAHKSMRNGEGYFNRP